MATPVTKKVYFTVTLTPENRGTHWAVRTDETGIMTYGATQDEATKLNGAANVQLVTDYKARGKASLELFLKSRRIEYSFEAETKPTGLYKDARLAIAA